MYKTFTATDFKTHLGLSQDYTVEGFLIFGTYQNYPYDMLRQVLAEKQVGVTYTEHKNEFLKPIQEFTVNNKTYWFVVAYGGALLSEYLHLASLFGSQKNILLGSCGGLKPGAKMRELIIPDWSYGEESSAKAYQPESEHKYESDKVLSSRLRDHLSKNYTVYNGPTVTYQAMLGETQEDVINWSREGFFGVEMEAATVFAVSKHFKIASAAILQIADNLIEQETSLDSNYDNTKDLRRMTSRAMFDAAISELL